MHVVREVSRSLTATRRGLALALFGLLLGELLCSLSVLLLLLCLLRRCLLLRLQLLFRLGHEIGGRERLDLGSVGL